MSVVPAHGAYVVANYKETQLTDVREGQAVDIAVDMFPGQIVHGHVDSIAPASGQEFALLPPDNATGNFTKVVQRIPVRIALDTDSNARIELRPGMSVIPTIETRRRTRARAAAARRQHPQDRFRSIVPCQITALPPRYPRFRLSRAASSPAATIRTAPASRPGSPFWPP